MALKTEKEIFEKEKTEFKNLYGQDWSKDLQLYTQYLQTVYLRTIYGILEGGVNAIHNQQLDTQRSIEGLKGKLDDLKKK